MSSCVLPVRCLISLIRLPIWIKTNENSESPTFRMAFSINILDHLPRYYSTVRIKAMLTLSKFLSKTNGVLYGNTI